MGLCNLHHVDEEITKRRQVVERYRMHLSQIPGIQIMQEKEGVQSNYAYFPAVFDETIFGETRDMVFARLKEHNIFTRKYFYPLTSDLECFNGRFDVSMTPIAKQMAERVLTLPMAASLESEDVDRICDIILENV